MAFDPIYWISNFPGYWDSTDNWSLSSGGPPAGILPDNSNLVIFDSNGPGTCFVNTPVDIASLSMDTDFAGNVIQFDSIKVSNDSSFLAGIFYGQNYDIDIDGSVYIRTNFV